MKEIINYIAVFLIASTVFLGCNKKDNNTSNNKEIIKIGSILPLTGPAAVYGEYAKNGQLKALEKINNENSTQKKIEIIFEDGKGDPKESINIYKKLRNDGINIFITTLSPVSLAILPLAKNDNVLLFADAAHPEITASLNNLIFRHSNTAIQEANIISDYLSNIGVKKVGIIYVNDDYGLISSSSLKTYCINKGMDVFYEPFDKSQTDFIVLVQKIKKFNPEHIVVIGSGTNMGIFIKELDIFIPESKITANIGYIITGANKTAGEAGNKITYVNFNFNVHQQDVKSQINNFEILEYGTVMLLGTAINNSNSDPMSIANYIRNLKEFSTDTEKMNILQNNDIIPELKIDGKE